MAIQFIRRFLDAVPSSLKSANEIYNFARQKYKQEMGTFPSGIDDIGLKRGAAELQEQRNKVVKFDELTPDPRIKQPKNTRADVMRAHENISGGSGYAEGDTKFNADVLADEIAIMRGANRDDLSVDDSIKLYNEAYKYLTELNRLNRPSPGKGQLSVTIGGETKNMTPEGIMDFLMKRGKAQDTNIGKAPKTTKTKSKVDPKLQAMEDQKQLFLDFGDRIESDAEKIARMKRENKEAVARLKKKKEKDLGDKLKDLPDDIPDMAGGGLAYMLGEPRVGLANGGLSAIPPEGIKIAGGRIVPSIQDPGSGKFDLLDENGVPTAISRDQVEMALGISNPNQLMSFTGSSYEDNYTPEELKLLRTIPVSDYNTQGGGPITQRVRNQIATMRGDPLPYPLTTPTTATPTTATPTTATPTAEPEPEPEPERTGLGSLGSIIRKAIQERQPEKSAFNVMMNERGNVMRDQGIPNFFRQMGRGSEITGNVPIRSISDVFRLAGISDQGIGSISMDKSYEENRAINEQRRLANQRFRSAASDLLARGDSVTNEDIIRFGDTLGVSPDITSKVISGVQSMGLPESGLDPRGLPFSLPPPGGLRLEDINQTGFPRPITQDDIDTFNFQPPGQDPGFFPGGVTLDSRTFQNERDAIAGLGIERYNQLMATGGRVGFADGGMSRRTFLKIMAALASFPVAGKLFKTAKVAKKTAPIVTPTSDMPAHFPKLVEKMIREGQVVDSEFVKKTGNVKTYKHPDKPDLELQIEGDGDVIRLEFETDQGMKGGYEFRKGDIVDEPTSPMRGQRGPNEFYEGEIKYRSTPEGDYYKDFEEGIETGTENLDKFAGVGKQKSSKSKVNLDAYDDLGVEDELQKGGLAGLLGE